ncbi:MAG: hypothetical protein LBL67_03025 [Coriobacteriales bacterium]|jgi:hypothetical protein|nr:hypothetical protein [Coriobacteriales bacterium]
MPQQKNAACQLQINLSFNRSGESTEENLISCVDGEGRSYHGGPAHQIISHLLPFLSELMLENSLLASTRDELQADLRFASEESESYHARIEAQEIEIFRLKKEQED